MNSGFQNRKVGNFLKDYQTNLPLYVNKDYKGWGIGYYSGRIIIPTKDALLIDGAVEKVFHQKDKEVFVGKDSVGKGYLMIKIYE